MRHLFEGAFQELRLSDVPCQSLARGNGKTPGLLFCVDPPVDIRQGLPDHEIAHSSRRINWKTRHPASPDIHPFFEMGKPNLAGFQKRTKYQKDP